MRVMMLTLLGAVLACSTTYRKERPDLPLGERGVVELGTLLREFNKAVEEHRFDEAQQMLEELEEGIKHADVATIAHPDYTDVSMAVDRGGAKLKKARRDWAMTQLIKRMQQHVTAGEKRLTELKEKAPTDDALDDLEDRIEELKNIRKEGKEYQRDEPYATFANAMEPKLELFVTEHHRHRWVLTATARLNDVLVDIKSDTPEPSTIDAAIDRNDELAEVYGTCEQVGQELVGEPGAAKDLAIETPFGSLPIEKAIESCAAKRAKATDRGYTLRWQRDVQAVATRASEALVAIEKQETPNDILEANTEAVEALTACESELLQTETKRGYDATHKFDSHMGKSNAISLREKCAKVRQNLVEIQPTLHWRMAVASLKERIEQAREEVKEANAEVEATDKLDPLSTALAGFHECLERADHISAKRDPQMAGAKPSRKETKALKNLRKACVNESKRVEKLADAARAQLNPPTKKKRRK